MICLIFNERDFMKQYIMETFGTFFLVLAIALTAGLGHAPFAIGLMLMALVIIGGHISGAHYNPAVTIAAWLYKKISTTNAIGYIISQMVGSLLAAAVFQLLTTHLWSASSAAGVTTISAIAIEALLTSILCGVILTVTATEKFVGNHIYGIAIGLTLTAIAFVGGSLSGGAFNPAVGIMPIIYKAIGGQGLDVHHLLIYSVGPLLGGALATLYISYFNDKTTK